MLYQLLYRNSEKDLICTMNKDIERPIFHDVAIAIVPLDINALPEPLEWKVYLVNLRESALMNVLLVSEGYGQIAGEEKKTSVLRHFFEQVAPNTALGIETIFGDMLHMTNQFWLSFYDHSNKLYDKKYVFVQEAIHQDLLTDIPLIGKKGVMIR